MKLDEKAWMAQFCQAVKDEFGGRIVCIGLQGSRGRGEEREDSDIDMVVVLDRVELEDLDRYRRVVANLPCRELLCGFVSGKEELLAWEPGDLFQFYHDTAPVVGDLEFLRGHSPERTPVGQSILACAIYTTAVYIIIFTSEMRRCWPRFINPPLSPFRRYIG